MKLQSRNLGREQEKLKASPAVQDKKGTQVLPLNE